MTSEVKQLEGLGRLLKAAGVKPAGAEQMIREHLDSMQDEARLKHAEIVETARMLGEELIELRHNHAFALSEIRISTDLMRREVEASNMAFARALGRAKKRLAVLIIMQVAIISVLLAPTVIDFIRLLEFVSAPLVANTQLEADAKSDAADVTQTQIKR